MPKPFLPPPCRCGSGRASAASPWLGLTSALIFAFLYLPLVVVVLYSFSATKVNAWPIKGYTLDWYRELIADRDIHEAVQALDLRRALRSGDCRGARHPHRVCSRPL